MKYLRWLQFVFFLLGLRYYFCWNKHVLCISLINIIYDLGLVQ